MQCELRTEENFNTLDKINKNKCGTKNLNLNVFVGYSPQHSYYIYCGATQPKVYFFTKTSFYNDIPKIRNIPFKVAQDKTTKTNFNLKIEDPFFKDKFCLFSIKTGNSFKNTCVITKTNDCYKYCYGETILVDSAVTDAVTTYEVKITTKHGEESYKIAGNKVK